MEPIAPACLLLAGGAVLAALLLLLRWAWLVARPSPFVPAGSSVKTLVVLGSGGHTAEMLMLLEGLDKRFYSPRVYVVAETDRMSATRALGREAAWAHAAAGEAAAAQDAGRAAGPPGQGVSVCVIPRSREVGQSYVTSVATTLRSLGSAAWVVLRTRPRLVLVNGPGTCIPVCAAAWLCRLLWLSDSRVVYVESIARVRKLSLSGLILWASRVADAFFVQWPELQARYPRSTFAGRLY